MIRNVSKEALGNSKENRFRTDSQISERIPKDFQNGFPTFQNGSAPYFLLLRKPGRPLSFIPTQAKPPLYYCFATCTGPHASQVVRNRFKTIS